jgi:hypothetical protein
MVAPPIARRAGSDRAHHSGSNVPITVRTAARSRRQGNTVLRCHARRGHVRRGYVRRGSVRRGYVRRGHVRRGHVRRGYVWRGYVRRPRS